MQPQSRDVRSVIDAKALIDGNLVEIVRLRLRTSVTPLGDIFAPLIIFVSLGQFFFLYPHLHVCAHGRKRYACPFFLYL